MTDAQKHSSACLKRALQTFKDKGKVYGDGYVRHGEITAILFPDGIHLQSPEDFARFSLLNCLIMKLIRYSDHFKNVGHKDSIHDFGVYSFILEGYDEYVQSKE